MVQASSEARYLRLPCLNVQEPSTAVPPRGLRRLASPPQQSDPLARRAATPTKLRRHRYRYKGRHPCLVYRWVANSFQYLSGPSQTCLQSSLIPPETREISSSRQLLARSFGFPRAMSSAPPQAALLTSISPLPRSTSHPVLIPPPPFSLPTFPCILYSFFALSSGDFLRALPSFSLHFCLDSSRLRLPSSTLFRVLISAPV